MSVAVEAASRPVESEVSHEFKPGDPFVHMHIPKTAGTSLRRMLEDEFGAENVLLYVMETDSLLPANQRQLTIPNQPLLIHAYERVRKVTHAMGLSHVIGKYIQGRRQRETIEADLSLADTNLADYKVMTGHIDGSSLKTAGLDRYPLTTVVREPLKRAVSFYRHWERHNGEIFYPFFGGMAPADTSFEEVALMDEQQNFQSKWLNGVELERIGVVDKLGGFLGSLGLKHADRPFVVNQDPSRAEKPRLDKGFVREFEAANTEDYELYYQALDNWS